MLSVRPRPEALEAAAKAMWVNGPTTARRDWDDLSDRQIEFAKHEARAAIAEFCRVEGLTVEKLHAIEFDQQRLVGPWRSVDE